MSTQKEIRRNVSRSNARRLRLEQLEGRWLLNADAEFYFRNGNDDFDSQSRRSREPNNVEVRSHNRDKSQRDSDGRETNRDRHRDKDRNDQRRSDRSHRRSESDSDRSQRTPRTRQQDSVAPSIPSNQVDELFYLPPVTLSAPDIQLTANIAAEQVSEQFAFTVDTTPQVTRTIADSSRTVASNSLDSFRVDTTSSSISDSESAPQGIIAPSAIAENVEIVGGSTAQEDDGLDSIQEGSVSPTRNVTLASLNRVNESDLEPRSIDTDLTLNAALPARSPEAFDLLSWLQEASVAEQSARDLEQTIDSIAQGFMRRVQATELEVGAAEIVKDRLRLPAQQNLSWLSNVDDAILLVGSPHELAVRGSLVQHEMELIDQATWTAGVGFIQAIEFAGELGLGSTDLAQLAIPASATDGPIGSTAWNLSPPTASATLTTALGEELQPLIAAFKSPVAIGITVSVLGLQLFRGKYRPASSQEDRQSTDTDEFLFTPDA